MRRGKIPWRALAWRSLATSSTPPPPLPPPHRHHLIDGPVSPDDAAADPEEATISASNHLYWRTRIHAAAQNSPDDALRLLDRLRLRGFQPDSCNLSSIVHALCDSGRFEEAHRRLLLGVASNWVPDDRTSNVLIARLLDGRRPRPTHQLVRRLVAAKPGFLPSLTNYNRIIDQYCNEHQSVLAHEVLLELRGVGHMPDTVSYTTLIDGFGRVGDTRSAHQLFDEMLKSGVPPNALTYSALIKGVLRKRTVDQGRELMSRLWRTMGEEADPSVNSAAFANLINALCREGYFGEVFKIAEEMPQGNCVHEEFAYGQMIDSLCQFRRHHGASRIVYIMRKRGFAPSLVSYNCIVHNLCKMGEGGCMRAYQLFQEGIKFGYSLPEPTYKVLVESLCRAMDIDKAKDVTELMLKKEGTDKTRIYNIFLSALRFVDNPSEQLSVLVLMLQDQCQPDVVTLNTVIHGFCKIGKINEAARILNDMLGGKFCAPDTVTFTTIINGLLDAGKIEEALDILHCKMPERGCNPNIVTYNVILRGLCKLNEIDKSLEVFNGMVSAGMPPDSMSYAVMIGGLWDSGRIIEAKRFWDDVIWPSKVHDDFVYSAILRGLCKLGKLNEACDFLYELVDCGVSPGIVNYNILIDNCCKLGLRKEAYQIVGEMRKNGLKPDAVTWRILEKLHGKEREGCVSCVRNSESQLSVADGTISASFMSINDKSIDKMENKFDMSTKREEYPSRNEFYESDAPTKLIVGEVHSYVNDHCIGTHNFTEIKKERSLKPEDQREPLFKIANRLLSFL